MIPTQHEKNMTSPPSLTLLGTQLTLYDQADLLAFIGAAIAAGEKRLILSGNIYSYNLAYEQPWLRTFFNHADVVRVDGAGVRLGARLLGHATPPRMTWADFAWDLADYAAAHQYRCFLLGAKPGIAERAAVKLQEHAPNFRIVGTHHGYFNKETAHPENQAVINQINGLQPDLLIVGFGMPLQERWLAANWAQLTPRVTMTGGAVFDYLSGELTRAPQWMTDHGLEWLGRMLIEPRRLWRRYVIGNPQFFWRVAKQRAGFTPPQSFLA